MSEKRIPSPAHQPENHNPLAYCSANERSNLALAYHTQGERALLKGDPRGLELFEMAAQLDPCNPELFYRQGLSLFEYGSSEGREKSLLTAAKKLKTAVHLAPSYFEAWRAWGSILLLLGDSTREQRYFLEAEEKLRKALELGNFELQGELQWEYGKIWTRIAHFSGEAVDLQKALASFQQSSEEGKQQASEFWIDYGAASLEMAGLLNDSRLIVKAVQCFKHAVSDSSSSFEGWMMLARSLRQLYKYTHDEDHFTQAQECFSMASQYAPYHVELWQEWAVFLLDGGSLNRDIKRLKACLEKCQQGYALNARNPELLAIWGEALALLGELTDKIDYLYEAQNKIHEALELSHEESAEVWHSYAKCLYSWGAYFADIDYYYQAIEKFQEGISIDRTRHQDWYAIAKAYSRVGDSGDDMEAFEKAARFYTKAIDLKPNSYYYFEYAYTLSRLGEMKRDAELLQQSISYFEYLLQAQQNALYTHPEWLYHYGITLDFLGDYHEDESYYQKALEVFSQVLMIDPDFPRIHYRIGLAYTHLGEALGDTDHFQQALHHYRLAHQHEEDNDFMILDWGITLIHIAQHSSDKEASEQYLRDAELKLLQSAQLGNQQAFYQLGGLYSLLREHDKAMQFIQKAHEAQTLPPLEEILDDDWLEGLRLTASFQEFLAHLKCS